MVGVSSWWACGEASIDPAAKRSRSARPAGTGRGPALVAFALREAPGSARAIVQPLCGICAFDRATGAVVGGKGDRQGCGAMGLYRAPSGDRHVRSAPRLAFRGLRQTADRGLGARWLRAGQRTRSAMD